MEECESSGKRMKSGGGTIETSRAEKAVWLMKCPALASRSLAHDSSRPIAKLILSIDPLNDNSSHQFTMELADDGSGNAPKSYSMDMTEDFIPMSVFSESSQGKIAVEGKILHKFDMRPHNENLDSYAKICRQRTHKYMTKSRQIQVIDNDNGSHMRPMPLMIASGFSDHKKKGVAKSSEVKRTRRGRGEMEDIMFKLFERQPNWSLKQLIQETDQPEQFLKDILKDLCVYNNKGTNQGSYELKSEYKKSCEDPIASASNYCDWIAELNTGHNVWAWCTLLTQLPNNFREIILLYFAILPFC